MHFGDQKTGTFGNLSGTTCLLALADELRNIGVNSVSPTERSIHSIHSGPTAACNWRVGSQSQQKKQGMKTWNHGSPLESCCSISAFFGAITG